MPGPRVEDRGCVGQVVDDPARSLFEAVFRENYDALIRFVRRRVGSDADARDIAQDAYLRLMRYDKGQDRHSLRALVFRIAGNLLGMRARAARAQHWVDHEPVGDELAAESPSPEQETSTQQQVDRMMEVIQRLPTKCQRVFVLSRFHDMDYQQIASRLGISVKMVEKHIAKALAICRAEVG